jgi:indole-3-glycerol phosphate synthase
MANISILDQVVSHKYDEVGRNRAAISISALEACGRGRPPALRLSAVLARPGVSLIAEVKRRSPSNDAYATDFVAGRLARIYAANGAAAISALADQRFFGGGAEVVHEVVAAAGGSVPVLYKDFVVDPYQVAEARALGADAVLIIVRATDVGALRESISYAAALGMDCVVETFTPEDIHKALVAGARIIGINNRDLATFTVNIERSAWMRAALPPDVLSISESGLSSSDDVRRAGLLGFDAVLIGEAILRASDVAGKVRELSGAGRTVLTEEAGDERAHPPIH